MSDRCRHADEAIETPPLREEAKAGLVCEECVKIGSDWVHLRICRTCGKVGCCDNSPNRHATRHANESGHPIISSAQPGEKWTYCYVDDLFWDED